jgi:SAM-dependent methyltransferase
MMRGHYVSGCGRAHKHVADLAPYFNCPMFGTFNVQADAPITDFRPYIDDAEHGRRFWLVRLNGTEMAWAYRWAKSRQPETRLELVSKAPLPDSLKEGGLDIEVLEQFPIGKILAWAKRQSYWFQSFPWSPQRADSALVWRTIQPHADWSGKTVLDIGCHYGFHCFEASKAGARVTGFDTDPRPIETARIINDHIEMQDVTFTVECPPDTFDVIMYLSVQHQWDAAYRELESKLAELRSRARDKVFVELIAPDLKRRLAVEQIDATKYVATGEFTFWMDWPVTKQEMLPGDLSSYTWPNPPKSKRKPMPMKGNPNG